MKKQCIYCQKSFETQRNNAIFCSNAHRMAYKRGVGKSLKQQEQEAQALKEKQLQALREATEWEQIKALEKIEILRQQNNETDKQKEIELAKVWVEVMQNSKNRDDYYGSRIKKLVEENEKLNQDNTLLRDSLTKETEKNKALQQDYDNLAIKNSRFKEIDKELVAKNDEIQDLKCEIKELQATKQRYENQNTQGLGQFLSRIAQNTTNKGKK